MYGGTVVVNNVTSYLNDVWVLSIPSFLWIAVNHTNNGEPNVNGQSAGRFGHTCTMWQEDRMIVLGGVYLDPESGATNPQPVNDLSVCGTSESPIRLLDTSTYSWQTQFIPNTANYSVPSVVYNVIGGE